MEDKALAISIEHQFCMVLFSTFPGAVEDRRFLITQASNIAILTRIQTRIDERAQKAMAHISRTESNTLFRTLLALLYGQVKEYSPCCASLDVDLTQPGAREIGSATHIVSL
ncbi:hypothetical protein CBL_01404 [Carabus blaptoides fortunei]